MNSRPFALLGSLTLAATTAAFADPSVEETLRQSPLLDAPGPGYTRPATFANSTTVIQRAPVTIKLNLATPELSGSFTAKPFSSTVPSRMTLGTQK